MAELRATLLALRDAVRHVLILPVPAAANVPLLVALLVLAWLLQTLYIPR